MSELTFDDLRVKLSIEQIPLKVLLDTTVVQNLLIFGEYIFGNYLSNKLSRKLDALPVNMQNDIHALRNIFGPTIRSPLVPIISVLSLHELSATRNEEKCAALVQWGFELLDYSVNVGEYESNLLASQKTSPFDFLPGENDRVLICECIRAECQAFITMDYRTILRFRSRIEKEHINVLSPSEWLAILEPWWALWV